MGTAELHVVILRCVLAGGAFLMLVLFSIISNKSSQEKQLVILYGLTIFGTPGLIQWVFQAFDRMQWVALASVIRWSVFAGLVLLYVVSPGQVWVVPLIELGAIACIVVFNFSVFHHSFGALRQPFDFSLAWSLLRQAVPIGMPSPESCTYRTSQ